MSKILFEYTRSKNETLRCTFTSCPTFRLYLCRVSLNPDGLESNSLRCLLSRFQIGNKYSLYLEVSSFGITSFVKSEQKYSLERT